MSDTTPRPSPLKYLLPAGIFFFALVLRLVGIGWGLKNDLHNHSYHPDEPVVFAYSQAINPAGLDFTPGFYNYGTLYLTVLRVATDVTAAYTGAPDPKVPDSLFDFASRVHMAGRLVSAVSGAALALLVFLILRRFTNRFGASIGALAVAVAPGLVIHSRFQTVDVFATFLLTLSFFFALRLLPIDGEEPGEKAATRDLVLSALFAGLSAGTKYTGVLAILTLLSILFFSRRPKVVKEGLIALGVLAVGFLVATPGFLLESEKFWEGFKYEMQHTATGHGLLFVGTANGFVYHFSNLIQGMGIILVLMGLVGLGIAASKKQVWAIALLAFFIPYFVVIGRAEVKFLRYTFPLIPVLGVGVGVLSGSAHERKGWGKAVAVLGILGVAGLDSRGLIGAANATAWMAAEDPRDAAVRFLRQTEPTRSVGLVRDPWFWNPPLYKDAAGGPMSGRLEDRLQQAISQSNPPATFVIENGTVPPFDARLVTEVAPDRIVFTTLESAPYEKLVGRRDIPLEAQAEGGKYESFMRALGEKYRLERSFGVRTFQVEDLQYIQPVVLVWKRNDLP